MRESVATHYDRPLFAFRVEQARRRRGLTRKELAELAGYSAPAWLYRIETLAYGTRLRYREALAEALGVSRAWLEGRE